MRPVLLEPPHSQKRMWQHIMIKEEIMDVVGVMVDFMVLVAIKEVVGTKANFAYEHKDDDNPDGPEDHNNTTNLDNMDCLKIDDEDICLVDNGSTHTVLKKRRYFSHLTTQKANISTISGVVNIIEGFGKAHVLLPGRTNLKIENALYSPKSQRNLLNFKDIRKNGYHIETMDEGESEYLLITNISSEKKMCWKNCLCILPAYTILR
ncbi:hypothetical protein OSB04_006475 [Centaurea solstitialis]|uniref:Retrovirus-related Pol polyprotein from transposon TNT 1-94-like beta-barrel domain-containing protein n=1 Tax=Centaurea solstitialis TaxID=347529 RepID=A0AA38THZ8_9ASTR|nr:hypothetical protein OSB04_006475 [Centaurea solstitialis]